MRKKFLVIAAFSLLAFVFGILGSFTYNHYTKKNTMWFNSKGAALMPVGYRQGNFFAEVEGLNFVKASEKGCPAVVFIKAIKQGAQQNFFAWDMFFDFFNNQMPSIASGSGVIISSDGYIVTNHHVIKNADKLEIIVSNHKKSFTAKVIGIDGSSDLALLKIEAQNLPAIEFGNSDEMRVGDWVVAVGNPFNLYSTVTCGIVSAKGRNINLVQNNFPIESFIQTDAAINPGNSGGALVDVTGKLIGINTAILSQTGSYAGYGFAIPSNIVKKVVEDLQKYGVVQRAFIEAEIIDIDEDLAAKIKMEDIQGVYVNKVNEGANADKAGLKVGDIILKANDVLVPSRSVLDEQLAYLRPGDNLKLEVTREGKVFTVSIQVTNSEGNVDITKNVVVSSTYLGASFSPLTKKDKDLYGIDYGVKVTNVKNGLMSQLGIPDGFIILSINNQKFSSSETLVSTLEKMKGWLTLKGVTPEGWLITRQMRIY
jgi:serine protease Do